MSTTLNISNASSNQNNMPCQIRDNRALDISVIVFFCAILLSSLIGNTVIIIIFYRRKDLKKTTNYFIANMAISDLIFPLTPIPLSIIGLETLPVSVSAGSIVCKLQIFVRWCFIHCFGRESCLDRRGSVHCSGLSNQSSLHLHKVSPLYCDVHLDCCFINLLCSFVHGWSNWGKW